MDNFPDYTLTNATISSVNSSASVIDAISNRCYSYDDLLEKYVAADQSVTFRVKVSDKDDHSVNCRCEHHKKAKPDPVPIPTCIMTNEKLDKVLKDGKIKPGGLFTTVQWNDGTYTTVKASKDDGYMPSPYMAFCAALAKKLYGSNAAIHRMVERNTKEYQEAQKAKEAAEQRAKERAAEQAAHERALLREAKRLRLKAEAKAYNIAHTMDKE